MDIIQKRWSPRKYKDTEISEEALNKMMEAARWTPSAYNEQPWRFIYAHKGTSLYDKIHSCLHPFNQEWAGSAPLLMLTLSSKNLSQNGKFNPHHAYDTGAAVMAMTLEAMDMDIYSRQMGGILHNEIIKTFEVSDDFEIICALAFGYTDEVIPEDRARKSTDDLFLQEWNN